MRRAFVIAAMPLVLLGSVSPAAQERELGSDVRMHSAIPSKHLPKPRDVIVWLPPGYEKDRQQKYPVLYMHDGANVYIEWRIDEVAKRLIASQHVEPLIIVMIPNGGSAEDRFEDYTPTRPANARFGGKADAYGRFVVEEVKPFIDREYRTLTDAANTGLGGASLGGLVTLHLGLEFPDIFGKLAVMSPSVYWDNKLIVRKVKETRTKPATRIWLDVGRLEPPTAIANIKELRDALLRKGWTAEKDFLYYEAPDAKHDDVSFGRRADAMLKFLFPARTVSDVPRSNGQASKSPR